MAALWASPRSPNYLIRLKMTNFNIVTSGNNTGPSQTDEAVKLTPRYY